eukprot:gene9237-10199_t
MRAKTNRYLTCKGKPSLQAQQAYQEVFPALIQEAQRWQKDNFPANKNSPGWDVVIHPKQGIYIDFLSQAVQYSRPIVLPRQLDPSFSIGWQHRSYNTFSDPKYTIAEILMKILVEHPVLRESLVEEVEEENSAELGSPGFDDAIFDNNLAHSSESCEADDWPGDANGYPLSDEAGVDD